MASMLAYIIRNLNSRIKLLFLHKEKRVNMNNDLNNILSIIALLNISVPKESIYIKIQNIKLQKEKAQKIKLALLEEFESLDLINYQTNHFKFSGKDKEKIKTLIPLIKKENIEIYNFINKLLQNTKIDNLKNLILNFPYITIKYHSASYDPSISGTYNGKTKEIHIYNSDNKVSLHHELLHASSADIRFMVLKNGLIFGKGLNEGYTELLNNRFFNYTSTSYNYLQKLAKQIENLCTDKENMIEYYFNADIFSLISELIPKISLKEIIDILVDMDMLLYNENKSYLEYLKIKEKIRFIQNKNKVKKLLVKSKKS